jgi:hypothetical protein
MAKVHRDAAKFQTDVSNNFQQALKKFEGMIAAGTMNAKPQQPPPKNTPIEKGKMVVTPPTPAIS